MHTFISGRRAAKVFFIAFCLAALLLPGCSREKEQQVYKEPVFSGVAYILATATNHLAVIDLADNKLSRVTLDRKADFTTFDRSEEHTSELQSH